MLLSLWHRHPSYSCAHTQNLFPGYCSKKYTNRPTSFCFISEFVLILFVCSFWESYDNYAFSSLVAFVSDLITALYYCKMYMYFFVL